MNADHDARIGGVAPFVVGEAMEAVEAEAGEGIFAHDGNPGRGSVLLLRYLAFDADQRARQ